MGHLISFRQGWQAEHLAKFILSKISFLSSPINISDDLGVDFSCTLFKVNGRIIVPQSTFSIQIKSNKKSFDISNKTQYLLDLNIPFLVGVCYIKTQRLVIYSGEALDHFFSKFGNPSGDGSSLVKTKVVLIDNPVNFSPYIQVNQNLYEINFRKICEIKTDEAFNTKSLLELVNLIQKNITSRKYGEYILQTLHDNTIHIFAGTDSNIVFRENFYKQLASVFYNMLWIYNNQQNLFNRNELQMYKTLYNQINNPPAFLTSMYDLINQQIP